jgi:hypothetical protein
VPAPLAGYPIAAAALRALTLRAREGVTAHAWR